MRISHPTYGLIRSLLLPAFPDGKPLRILDFGCGDGALLRYLPEERVRGYHGVDVNAESVALATKQYGRDEVRFCVVATGEFPLPVDSGSIDAFIMIGVLQYVVPDQRSDLIAEAWRTLRPGGVFIGSCASAHAFYRLIDLYRFASPHVPVGRQELQERLLEARFEIDKISERGLLVSPLFAHIGFLLFDVIDKMLFRTRGTLGSLGKTVRLVVNPLLHLEYLLPVDYGYTLYVRARKPDYEI